MSVNTFENQAKAEVEILGNSKTFFSNKVTANLASLTIVKSQSLAVVTTGDEIKYSFVITNIGVGLLNNILFTDIIPVGLTYLPNSFKVNSVAVIPTILAQTISYTINSIVGLGVTNIEFICTVD